MSLIHHPDKNGGDDTMFKQIKDAYETLSNPMKRKQYDSTDDNVRRRLYCFSSC